MIPSIVVLASDDRLPTADCRLPMVNSGGLQISIADLEASFSTLDFYNAVCYIYTITQCVIAYWQT
jgi:hypothetical protein